MTARTITEDEVLQGLRSGIIRIEDEYADGGVIARIGDNWFYFAGQEGENMTAAEYLANVPEEDIACKISEVLGDFQDDDEDEWLYYRYFIDEELTRLA